MAVVTPVIAVIGLGLAFVPAGNGNLLLVGIIKVVAYLLLGVVYALVVRTYDRKLVDLSLMLKGMAGAIGVTLLMLLLPDSMGWGIGSAVVTCAVGLVAGIAYLKRLRSY